MKLSTKIQILASLSRESGMSPRMSVSEVARILSGIKARSRQDAQRKIATAFGF